MAEKSTLKNPPFYIFRCKTGEHIHKHRNPTFRAEREGFEPPVQQCRTADFESAPFDHSGIFPSLNKSERKASALFLPSFSVAFKGIGCKGNKIIYSRTFLHKKINRHLPNIKKSVPLRRRSFQPFSDKYLFNTLKIT